MEPTLKFFMIGGEWGLPSISPFCLKLATWLRMTDMPHETVIEDDPRKGPKRKSPWIEDGEVRMGDSELIIEHLKRTRGVQPDAHLGSRDAAIGLCLQRTFEEHFHQITEYALWHLDQGWEQSSHHFDRVLPRMVAPLIKPLIRSGCRKEGLVRGVARHTSEEIAAMARADLEAARAILGDKPYLFGDQPTTADCTVYGFLAVTLYAPIEYFGKRELEDMDELVAFCDRMRDRYWSEESTTVRLVS